MSQENVERYRQCVAAYVQGDVEGMLEFFAPDVEWYPHSATVEGGEPYQGKAGVRKWIENSSAAFDTTFDFKDVRAVGNLVVASGPATFHFKSGIDIRLDEFSWVARYRDGLIVWGGGYESRAEALKAVGLSE